ncbi:MAG TPA: hypothetical protein VHU83_08795 [Bryobacteraceae bacterium]|jgi:hypothetical protein|nr:hypothetical protein [Bryobacteraceae bacterium]
MSTSAGALARAALGLRAHSGWAVLVAVAGTLTSPAVILRRRIEMCDRRVSGSVQPYHAARLMKLEAAQAFLNERADSSRRMASEAIRTALDELTAQGHQAAASCILLGSGRVTHGLAAILASHPAVHTAEGEFYRDALRWGCESCGLTVSGVKERDLLSQSAAALHLASDEIERRLAALGKLIGPPWRQDEKLCALASWLLLANSLKC